MTLEPIHPLPPDVAHDHPNASDTPSLDWPEAALRAYLAKVWNQHDAQRISVIGQIKLAESGHFGFLVDLHHAETGAKLPAPLATSRVHAGVFVPPGELRAYQNRWGNDQFALAELALSPLEERTKRQDPFACLVRPNTLTVLERIPESWWSYRTTESEALPLVLAQARQAIEARLRRETEDAERHLGAMRAEVAAVVRKKDELDDAYGKLVSTFDQKTKQIASLEAECEQRRNALEKRMRELEALLRERGERMVALDLVDRDDLNKLFPPLGVSEARGGHRFQDALKGDFQRLAEYIQAYLWRNGIRYSRAQLLDFLVLLRTNDLIVLAGDSGSGKTSMVKSVASAIGGRCTVVPVKPNWTGSDDLLGYYNPIEGRYRPSPFLQAILEAAREPEIPHFVCLDEMNLARVEYYFADFLSLLETRGEAPWIHLYSVGEERQAVVDNKIFLALEQEARRRTGLPDDVTFNEILLHDGANAELRKLAGLQGADTVLNYHARVRRSISGLIDIPAGFSFPPNVWIVGAINVDETTHYLSPKILDRAHVMRFRNPVLMNWTAIESELATFEGDASMPMNVLATDIGSRGEYPPFDLADPRVGFLVRMAQTYLDPLGIEFGLRAIRQALNYLLEAEKAGLGAAAALNNVALHKVLPKIILDLEKSSTRGQKRSELLMGLRQSLADELAALDRTEVIESAVDALDDLIGRAESNNGIANFWAR